MMTEDEKQEIKKILKIAGWCLFLIGAGLALFYRVIEFQPRYKSGVCRYCGCTDNDPCYNPNYGNCWWVDKEHTICSHCADELIVNDEGTIHCIVSKGLI